MSIGSVGIKIANEGAAAIAAVGAAMELDVGELRAQANQLSAIKESYIALKNSINETLKTVDGAWSTRLQSTFSSVMDEQLKNMVDFEKQLDVGINAAVYAADHISSTDTTLAATLESSVAYGERKLEREKSVTDNAARAIYMYNNGLKYKGSDYADWNGSGYSRSFTGVDTPHCTWYASSRYEAVNGEPLIFREGRGDAYTWPDYINKDYFNCDSTKNKDVIKTNTIAVSISSEHAPGADLWDSRIENGKGDWVGASANHVAYVEAVQDGYVYYSQGSSSWSMGSEGYIYRMTVDQFAVEYNYIISAK